MDSILSQPLSEYCIQHQNSQWVKVINCKVLKKKPNEQITKGSGGGAGGPLCPLEVSTA